MTPIARTGIALLLALAAAAQSFAQAPPRSYSQPELDQMLAPIALYPDALLSQVLMSATYPLEVVEAARWTRANPGLKGEAAVRAVQEEDWDPSVKSLVAFPQILQRMDENLRWTESLGDAFLAQEPVVMDTVQQLRQRAEAAGNLRSDAQIHVERQGPVIVVQPASPTVVYVPYYDPLVVYGPWWSPAYPPVVWAPWPGYARPYYAGVSAGFWWGTPVGLSVGFFFGNFDWSHRHVRVVHPTAYYYRPPVVVVNRTVVVDRGRWQHDPHHRRHIEYRATEVRQRYAAAQAERRDAQREERRDERPPARVQAQPPASAQVQPQARPTVQPQPQIRPATQPQAVERAQRQQQLQQQRQQSEVSRARQQQLRQQAEAARIHQQLQRPPQRQEQRIMPAAQVPQQPRAERQERREEHRGGRQEQRQERDRRG